MLNGAIFTALVFVAIAAVTYALQGLVIVAVGAGLLGLLLLTLLGTLWAFIREPGETVRVIKAEMERCRLEREEKRRQG